MKSLLAKSTSSLLDLFFPPFCVSCRAPGAWWCSSCISSVEPIHGHICPKCLTILPSLVAHPASRVEENSDCTDHDVGRLGRATCDDHICSASLPFSTVTALGYYHDPSLRAAITALKFHGTTALMDDIAQLITKLRNYAITEGDSMSYETIVPKIRYTIELSSTKYDSVLIPMPLSNARLNSRGFNQAQIIAHLISKATGLPISSGLLARADRQAQSGLDHDFSLRSKNINGAFQCLKPPPPRCILVDDVVTSGATASEAANLLLNSGAAEVELVALAIGA